MERLPADSVLSGKKALLSYRCVALGRKRLLFYFYLFIYFFVEGGAAVKNCKSDLWYQSLGTIRHACCFCNCSVGGNIGRDK